MDALFDKVTEGLKHCGSEELCDNCRYLDKDAETEGAGCRMFADALALIRELRERIAELEALLVRPRLLDLSELRALPLGTVVWREDRWPDEDGGLLTAVTPVMRSLCCGEPVLADGESQTEVSAIRLEADADGCQERYWSARPTEEQRKEADWG